MIAPDQTTFEYLEGREFAPQAVSFDRAVDFWESFAGDEGASFDRSQRFTAAQIAPQITWGTNPGQVIAVDGGYLAT